MFYCDRIGEMKKLVLVLTSAPRFGRLGGKNLGSGTEGGRGQPVAHNYGLLAITYWLFLNIVVIL